MNITARNNFAYVVCLYAGTNSCSLVLTYSFVMIITNFSENERSSHACNIAVFPNRLIHTAGTRVARGDN